MTGIEFGLELFCPTVFLYAAHLAGGSCPAIPVRNQGRSSSTYLYTYSLVVGQGNKMQGNPYCHHLACDPNLALFDCEPAVLPTPCWEMGEDTRFIPLIDGWIHPRSG